MIGDRYSTVQDVCKKSGRGAMRGMGMEHRVYWEGRRETGGREGWGVGRGSLTVDWSLLGGSGACWGSMGLGRREKARK